MGSHAGVKQEQNLKVTPQQPGSVKITPALGIPSVGFCSKETKSMNKATLHHRATASALTASFTPFFKREL